ncbi:DUF4340 domain-containing protein [Methylobacillus flagellatus]|uniref:DUF4340 domain-containing protein n=1 Tax=Methylobacillus flagellatus TaxID=405 RepID=UPI0028539B96|nr:DUF4340 domain-containing protein [Methylobacillus flagellatus]MDR5170757.1 DUF4340 domain-containing protein [Methylobacillus flagellatus]
MRSRWIVNLVLLLLVAGIVAFLYLKPQDQEEQAATYEVSSLKLSDFDKLSIEFPAKAPVVFEKTDGFWYLAQPYAARADQVTVQRIVSIVAGTSREKFSAEDPARFGLDNPRLRIRLNDEEFIFGLYNPVTAEQYVAYKDSVYLLSGLYSETAATQLLEMLDKSPLKPKEEIAGFDFSRLEQWEEVRLQLDRDADGKWQVSVPNAKPKQEELNEWFDEFWTKIRASSVEPYTPDRKNRYPSFSVKLKDGKQVHFERLQESPQLILGRPDEGMRYYFPPDIGFTMLNPPVGLGK